MIGYVKRNPFVTLKYLRSRFNLDYELTNISRILKKNKLSSSIARKKQKLTKFDRTRRKKFALENLNRNWSGVFFTDEKTMQNYHYGRVRVRRPRGQAFNPKYVVRYRQRRRFKVNYIFKFIVFKSNLINLIK